MTCYKPILGWLGENYETHKQKVYFCNPDKLFNEVRYLEDIQVPCGKCIGCRLDHSRMWATRCVHEAKSHEKNCFLTLTYNNNFLPENGSLVKEDLQKFWKRLRKMTGKKIRYFACGEYGSQLHRPHYHAIVFGFDFDDKYLFSVNHGQPLYRSPSLEKLWPFGYSTIGNVTFESCAYVARYVLKKRTGEEAQDWYKDKVPEFVVMSRRHGIGYEWLKKYASDVYNQDVCLTRLGTSGKIMKLRPPRYYDSIFDIMEPELMAELKARRKEYSIQHNSSYDYEEWKKSLLRDRAKETVKQCQASMLIRPFEEIKNE